MKKTWLVRTILAALLSCGMVFALASCSTNYTVSYSLGEHAADGAAAPESAEYEQGTQITLPEAPAAEDGWEFTAWSDGETTYDAGDSFTVEANVTFTAQWTEVTTPEPETYTVTFAVGANAADGAAAPAAVQVEDGESVTLPAGDDIPAAATGYHFDGWYVEGTKIEGTTYTPAADVTITATYAANPYTVAFDDNVDDSSVTGTMASQSFTYGAAQNLTDNAFTRTGYTFSGWATSAGGTVAYDDEESVNNLTAENGATVTLYAVWDPIAPTIKWEKTDNVTGNDPSGTIYSWNEESGNYTITLPKNTYSCAGSVFNGWVVVVNESSNSYQPGEKFTVAPGTEITISPRWKVTSTITFDSNGATGGTVPDAITGKVSGDTIDLPGNTGNLVRTGYTFVGWSETQDGNAIEGQYTVEGNVTLYAVWTANTYTVTLDYNYENAPADVTITVTFGSTFGAGTNWPTTDPVRDGFTFKGWWTANDGTGTQYTGATQVTTEAANLTLYAHWSATAVSVTFDYNDGTDSTEHDQIVPVEVNGTITAEDVDDPTRTGYRFEGWFTAADGGTKVEFPITNVTEPATYYAHWTQVWTVSVDGATVATLAEGKTYELGTPDARDGFTFMGWAVDGEIAYTTTDNTVTMGTENIVLTTVWADHSKISTEAELLAVLADATADTIKLADNIDMTTSGIDIRRDISIELDEKTITFTTSATAAAADRIRLTAYGTSYNDRIEVTITNGALGFNTNGNTNIDGSASMIFTQNVDLTMDGVAVTSDAMGLFIACGKLTMTDCVVTAAGGYAIGTNASVREGSELYGPVEMTIEGSTLTANQADGAGLLFNVEGELTLTDTAITGGRQGVVIRSGTATITGGSITSAWTDPDTDSYIDSWGSGTAVPMAALVIGDISANAYKNNTSVTISGTQVIVKGDPVPSAARYIYIAGDATDGTTATLTYACDDTYMSALADTNGIIVANDSASVVVTPSETLTYVEEQEATCTTDGTKEHYKCETCGALFILQNEVYVEVDAADLVIAADGVSHTYGAPTYSEGTLSVGCIRCDHTITATVTLTTTVDKAATISSVTYDAESGEFTIALENIAVSEIADDERIISYVVNGELKAETDSVVVAADGTIAIEVIVEDTSFTIGDTSVAGDWNSPQWISVLQKGETITYTGTMQSSGTVTETETGTVYEVYKTLHALLWKEFYQDGSEDSAQSVYGVIRMDYYLGGQEGLNPIVTHPNMGWTVEKHTNADTTVYMSVIASCDLTVRFDWANPNCLTITFVAVGNSETNNGQMFSMTYDITATSGSLPDWYYYGFTNEFSATTLAVHECNSYTNGVCSICDLPCVHDFADGTCTICGATTSTTAVNQSYNGDEFVAFVNWYDVPVALQYGSVLTISGSQTGANLGVDEYGNPVNFRTVIWEIKEGLTGRLDSHGWTFDPDLEGPLVSPFVLDDNWESVSITNAEGVVQVYDWAVYRALSENSDFTLTFKWITRDTLAVIIELTATSGTYQGYTYTNIMNLRIANDFNSSELNLHITEDGVATFTIDSYTVYTFANA